MQTLSHCDVTVVFPYQPVVITEAMAVFLYWRPLKNSVHVSILICIFEKQQADLQLLSPGEHGIPIKIPAGNTWHTQIRIIEEPLMGGPFAEMWGRAVPSAYYQPGFLPSVELERSKWSEWLLEPGDRILW